ncbi:hypothetical protein ACIOC1_01965 [Streptomyces sp. NPDC088197]|uniref:hypothetical protein n=1 Tax=Streptomyces sp. NPDC088197 TaxID=3365840 RepID=UPI00380757CA
MTTATSNSPTDRDPVPSRPPLCSAMTVLPDPLARTALAWAGDRHGIPADIRDLRCTLEHHTGGHHYALVHDVAESTAAWSRWLHDSTPDTLLVLPDCPASHPAHGGCGEYEGHPGGHTWQIDDPLEPPLHSGR